MLRIKTPNNTYAEKSPLSKMLKSNQVIYFYIFLYFNGDFGGSSQNAV